MLTKPLPGVMDDPFHPLSKGCVCHLLFNEGAGSLTYDVSGHGNHGTLKNMLPNVQGSGWGGSKFGGGLGFDGSTDYVDCKNGVDFNFGTGGFTFGVWVKADAFEVYDIILNKYAGSNVGWMLRQRGQSGDTFYCEFKYGGGVERKWNTKYLNLNQWYHVLIVHDADGNDADYIDGVYDSGRTANADDTDSATHFTIGGISGGSALRGAVDDVRVYNRALNVAEIEQLYHDPFCNIMQVPAWQLYSPAAPTGVIINQFQRYNLGADLYDGMLIT